MEGATGHVMRIHIESNFFVPGLENEESLVFDCPTMTLRNFLTELSKKAPTPIEYVRPASETLDPDDWQIDINGIPCQDYIDGLEALLNDGDTITIRVLALGGG